MDIRSPTYFNHTYASEHSGPSQKKNSHTVQMKWFDCITVLTMWVDIIENAHHEQCSQPETHIGSSNTLINLQLQCIYSPHGDGNPLCANKMHSQHIIAESQPEPSDLGIVTTNTYELGFTHCTCTFPRQWQLETWSRSSSLLAR